ncbi:hypothetical protein ACFVX3_32655 [Rhodococcus erythropolis]
MVDVVVWTESEEREKWWREIVGIDASGGRCGATGVGEMGRRTLGEVPRRCELSPTSLYVSAA